jgi:hypothetical protein
VTDRSANEFLTLARNTVGNTPEALQLGIVLSLKIRRSVFILQLSASFWRSYFLLAEGNFLPGFCLLLKLLLGYSGTELWGL